LSDLRAAWTAHTWILAVHRSYSTSPARTRFSGPSTSSSSCRPLDLIRRTTVSPSISLLWCIRRWPIVPRPRWLVSLDRCRAPRMSTPSLESISELCSPYSRTAQFPSGASRLPHSKLGAVDRHRLPYMSLFTAPPVLVPDTHTATLQQVVLVRPSAVVRHSVDSTVFDGEKIRDADTHFVR